MPSKELTVTEAVRHFSEYLNRVAYRKESFVLLRGKRPIAELRPVPAGGRLAELPKLLASFPRLTDREAKAFAEDIRGARESMPHEGMKDPWES